MSIRICGDNTVASPAITSASDTDTGLQFGTNEIKVVNGNLDITDGNLKVAAGHGIDFSASADGSGTVTSELLDDYEEGTWTPAWAASGTVTTDVANGNYTKIGDLCFLSFVIGSTGTPILTDTISITGVPFTIDTTTNMVRYQGNFEAIYFLVNSTTSYSLAPTSNVSLGIRETSNGGGNTNSLWNDVQAPGSFEIRGTIVYKVA